MLMGAGAAGQCLLAVHISSVAKLVQNQRRSACLLCKVVDSLCRDVVQYLLRVPYNVA